MPPAPRQSSTQMNDGENPLLTATDRESVSGGRYTRRVPPMINDTNTKISANMNPDGPYNGDQGNRRRRVNNTNNSVRSGVGLGGAMGMGTGMGMGMGGMGGMGYSSMMPMMGMYGMGLGMGSGGLMDNSLMRWMYVLNGSMYALSHLGSLVYMNAHTFYGVIRALRDSYLKLRELIAQSSVMIWLRDKTKKSKILRWLLIFVSMYLTSKIYDLLKRFVKAEYQNRFGRMTLDVSNNFSQEGAGVRGKVSPEHSVIASDAPIQENTV